MYKMIEFPELTYQEQVILLGNDDKNLKEISSFFETNVYFRNQTFMIDTEDEQKFEQIQKVLNVLYEMAQKGKLIQEQDLLYVCRSISENKEVSFEQLDAKVIGRRMDGKPISPKTQGQLEFIHAMEDKTVVFAIGPAGTGKTFLAVTEAVSALKRGDVKRIVLTRPAVEAGESLGFLPGDLKEKVDPYLTPLYDALHTMLGSEQTDKLIEKGTIEIAPLAYMRGRTLDDAYIILDEAQNTTTSQMKMFLTRLGFHSHMIITGDVTQIDLAKNVESGLIHATKVLANMDEIAILRLTADDVVRHPLVQKMIERYEKFDSRKF